MIFDLDLACRIMNILYDNASHHNAYVYQVSLQSIKQLRSYRPDKPKRDLWHWHSLYNRECFAWHFVSSQYICVPSVITIPQAFAKLSPGQAQTKCDLWPWPVTLTFTVRTWMLHMTRRLITIHKCTKFHYNPSSGHKVIARTSSDGQTDGRTGSNQYNPKQTCLRGVYKFCSAYWVSLRRS